MVQIPDQALKAVPALEDFAIIRDLSTGTDKRTTVGGVKTALAPVVSTDANGWTVYNYGSFQEYTYAFPGWSAPQPYGAAGTSFWNQARTSGMLPPVGKTFANLDKTVLATPADDAWVNGYLIEAKLVPTGPTATIMTYNPANIAVSTLNMNMLVIVQARTKV